MRAGDGICRAEQAVSRAGYNNFRSEQAISAGDATSGAGSPNSRQGQGMVCLIYVRLGHL